MKYKLLAIDMDDTLLSKGLTVSDRTQKAIKDAEKAGIKVVISTGRMFSSALPHLIDLGLTDEVITYNGALVKEIGSGRIIDHQPVDLEAAYKIFEIVKKEDLHINIYLNDILYVNKLGFGAEYYEKISGVKSVLIQGDISNFLDQPSTKLLIVEEDVKKADKIEARLENTFGDILNITRSKANFIEIMDKNVSKGATLSRLANNLGISADEVVAVGDSFNDLEMIEYAGLGVAVANAREEVKNRADYITQSNDEEGVAELIEKVIL
ncbi:Cof-type HAD-IIB family hydrolase [Orenia marismortui]|uniref:Cof-type HAD-IIB family hydrolase n=1 Tax=Orenia marismortui TaxID=46469 RepID=UPI0003813F3E|nr:Cof-type HAD-IIB family hydrolase [Orenia marismortui]